MLCRATVSLFAFAGLLAAPSAPARSALDFAPAEVAAPVEHPALLASRADFPALQSFARVEPGQSLRARAIAFAGGNGGTADLAPLVFDPAANPAARAACLAEILSTAALAYLLDEPGRPAYLARIVDHLRFWDASVPGNLTVELRTNDWHVSTALAGAFFNTTLALDLIHDDLAPAELDRIHALLEAGPAGFFADARRWKSTGAAAAGAWALYRDDRFTFEKCRDAYVEELARTLTPDGVFVGGPGYAFTTWADSAREQECFFGDILARADASSNWYADPRLKNFHEWLYGYAATPAGQPWAIGDTSADSPAANTLPPAVASRFSSLAARYAARLAQGSPPAPRLASYLLLARNESASRPIPAAAPSRIFPDGGAFFREPRLDPKALAGVLANIKTAAPHTHKEVNSLHLVGYGHPLLRGSGYKAWNTPASGFSWDYLNRRAVSGNTVLIDYEPLADGALPELPSATNDHRDSGGGYDGKVGAGVRGFTTASLDYATGDSGQALPNGRHHRDFIFVHPRDTAPGYFVALDAVQASAEGKIADLVWHPAAGAPPEVVSPSEEYTWTVSAPSHVGLTVFLATPPASLDLYDGALADLNGGYVGKYLFARYPLDPEARRQIVTVLYPHDETHPKARFTRIAGERYTGASLAAAVASRVVDTVFELNPAASVTLPDGASVQAASVLYRRVEDHPAFVFARDARSFRDGAMGFNSTAPVTLYLDETGGYIDSLGAILRIAHPRLAEITLDGVSLARSTTGDGWIEFALPPGAHTIGFTYLRSFGE
jgi:hypothetical protein